LLPFPLVFKGRQRLQDFGGLRPMDYRIVPADFSVAEDEHTLSKL